ncbi:glycosyltransferase, partial [Candidatus Sumerlaeota bacterium]|nr:glycosyltransferase [Candidatus Sumerlaeota bacterium]
MERVSLKILHTNFHKGWGGQSNRILTECRGLATRGHEVTIAAPEGSELAARARAAGLNVFGDVRFTRGFRARSVWRDIGKLRGLFRAANFDIIHTHGSQDSWAVAYSLLNYRPRPIILRTRHNIFPIRDHFMNRRLYGKWTDGIVCISEAILEDCAAKPYLRRDNLSLVHSAVDVSRFGSREGRDEIRREF